MLYESFTLESSTSTSGLEKYQFLFRENGRWPRLCSTYLPLMAANVACVLRNDIADDITCTVTENFKKSFVAFILQLPTVH